MPSPFHPLEAIGQGIYHHHHHVAAQQHETTTTTANAPRLVVLFTWLGGATPPRIMKYINGYRALYPTSSMLLVTTSVVEYAAAPTSMLRSRLAPARQVVLDAGPHVLWHIFSNGGARVAVQMALGAARPGPFILDCCPGDTTLPRMHAGAAHSLPRAWPARAVGSLLLWAVVGVVASLQGAGVVESVHDIRRRLNDARVMGTDPRLYLYSRADVIVRWEDVEAHMDEARARGFPVHAFCAKDSPHCALLRDDGPRYWAAVASFWDAAVESSAVRAKL